MSNEKKQETEEQFALPKLNYLLLIIGFIIIVIGFILMIGGKSPSPNEFDKDVIFSERRIIVAPIVVMFGFIFEIWAIMRKPRERKVN